MACERHNKLHLNRVLGDDTIAAVFVPCEDVHGSGPGSASQVIAACLAFVDSDDATGLTNYSSLTFRDGSYGFNFWFSDPNTAFAFKMRFG